MNESLRQMAESAAQALGGQFAAWGRMPSTFVQTGSGLQLDGLLDELVGELPLSNLPEMPEHPSPTGQALRLQWGFVGDRPVLVAQGRRHLYEGFGFIPCVLPVCAAVLAGAKRIVLLGAAGSINPDFRPGSVVALTDYINHLGVSPLIGPEPLGESYFPGMNEAYSQDLISSFINCLRVGEEPVRLGVYQANCGPQYETPAEIVAARRNGADLLGMSLVLETIAARALGAEILGLAVVANLASGARGTAPAHEKIRATVAAAVPALSQTLKRFLA